MGELISLLLTLYLYAFLLRFLLEIHRADFYNPISQTLVQVTDPVYLLFRRLIAPAQGWDIPLLLIMLGMKLILLYLSAFHFDSVSIPGIVLFAVINLVSMALHIYLACLIMTVVASWVQLTGGAQTALSLIHSLTGPFLGRLRRVLPDTGFLDFSPMLALLGLFFMQSVLRQISLWILN